MGVIPSKKGYLLQLPSMKPAMCTQNKKEISFNGNLNLLHSCQIEVHKFSLTHHCNHFYWKLPTV